VNAKRSPKKGTASHHWEIFKEDECDVTEVSRPFHSVCIDFLLQALYRFRMEDPPGNEDPR
jgi:hypothetical protein